jgi:pimeloyl-ACP methyl ester carboxylesterase
MPASGVDESAFQRARIGELRLSWSEAEPPAEGVAAAQPPLVLVHGFTGHRDDWIGVMPELARHRRVVALDLRGHGNSDAAPDASGYSFDQMVEDLHGLLEHLAIARCDLLGHSAGGMVALRFALAYPERLRSLILMNTASETPRRLDRGAWLSAVEIAEARGMAVLQTLLERAGRAAADPMHAVWGDRYWLHHRRRFGAMSPASYRGVGQSFFDSESMGPRLAAIETPTLVLVGEADAAFLPGAALLEAQLPDTRRISIPDAGHHPHQESKAAWLDAIESHLAGLAVSVQS